MAGVGALGWFYVVPLFGATGGDLPLTAKATRDDLTITVMDRGELESIDAVNVTCELEGGGKLVHIVAEGTIVKKGEVVAQLDTDLLQKAMAEQRVKLEAAEGKVQTTTSEVTQAESKQATENAKADKTLKLATIAQRAYKAPKGEFEKDRQKLKGQLELARKELVEAEEDLEFTKKQLRKGFGDLTAVKSKDLGVQQRQFQVKSAEAELTLLEEYTKEQKETELDFNYEDAVREKKLVKIAQESAVAKAKGEQKTAERTRDIEAETLKRIEKQMDRCVIKAPSDGMVLYTNRRYYGDQGMIRPGALLEFQQPIFNLPDFSKMRVKMKVHESQVKKVQMEQKATMKLDAVANRILKGSVSKIGTLAQNDGYWGSKVKAYETLINLDEVPSDAGLKPGMSAEVKILIRTIPGALVVPVSAVAEFEGQRVVYILTGRSVERREVSVGEENEQYMQVTDGLTEGESVALDARSRAAADLKGKKPGK